MTDAPRFENAPGIVVRPRSDGTFFAFWQCRTDIAARGYVPKTISLWRGTEPTDDERRLVSDTCNDAQTDMLNWGRGGLPLDEDAPYDGTLRTLVHNYKTDKDSPFQKIRSSSRENYSHFLRRIVTDHGDVMVRDIRARDVLRWHEAWSRRGVSMASGLVGHLRTVLTYGSTLLECKHCRELKVVLHDMRFPQGKPRDTILTADMANAIRAEAHAQGRHSIALAQAIQFETMLRQRDVIGEWVPLAEPGVTDITFEKRKWLRGITWDEIDADLTLTHVTSKRGKKVEINLAGAPMLVEEFARIGELPKKGPIIIDEATGRPYTDKHFRQIWRDIADAAGIPKNVQNRDARAGAITEATDAGASLEAIKHAATHSDIAMTQRYARGAAEKTAQVLQMRVAHRKNKSGT